MYYRQFHPNHFQLWTILRHYHAFPHPARVIKWEAIFIPTRWPLDKSRSHFPHLQGRNLFLLQKSQDILLETRMVRIFTCCLFSHLCYYDNLKSCRQTQVSIFGKIGPYQYFFIFYICIKLYLKEHKVSDPVRTLCISLKSLVNPLRGKIPEDLLSIMASLRYNTCEYTLGLNDCSEA